MNRSLDILRAGGLSTLLAALALAGCATYAPPAIPPGAPPGAFPQPLNPIIVGVMDRDFVWDQVVDVVDDYFRIKEEERVKLVGDLLTEGRLATFPRGSSTILEPWNKDSVDAYERWEATLQSTRRTALVRVAPAEAGFVIEVQVIKELEDVARPESGTVTQLNSQALRNDSSLTRVTNPVTRPPATLGWIEMGHDVALEQTILAQIQARMGGYGPPQAFY